jgi:hypothetical protein
MNFRVLETRLPERLQTESGVNRHRFLGVGTPQDEEVQSHLAHGSTCAVANIALGLKRYSGI